jgi:hypothetical protein
MSNTDHRPGLIPGFQVVPIDKLEALAADDWAVMDGDGDLLGIHAAPAIECDLCTEPYRGPRSVTELEELFENGKGVPCPGCEENCDGTGWVYSRPWHLFPFSDKPTTLLLPDTWSDRDWILRHAHRVAALGIFVYRSDRYGCLVGLDSSFLDPTDLRWLALRHILDTRARRVARRGD